MESKKGNLNYVNEKEFHEWATRNGYKDTKEKASRIMKSSSIDVITFETFYNILI